MIFRLVSFSIGCSLLTLITSFFAVFAKYWAVLAITSSKWGRIITYCVGSYVTFASGADITTSRRCTRACCCWFCCSIPTYTARFFAKFIEIVLVTSVTSTETRWVTTEVRTTQSTRTSGANIKAVRFWIEVWWKLR